MFLSKGQKHHLVAQLQSFTIFSSFVTGSLRIFFSEQVIHITGLNYSFLLFFAYYNKTSFVEVKGYQTKVAEQL